MTAWTRSGPDPLSSHQSDNNNIELEKFKELVKNCNIKQHKIINIDLRSFGGSALNYVVKFSFYNFSVIHFHIGKSPPQNIYSTFRKKIESSNGWVLVPPPQYFPGTCPLVSRKGLVAGHVMTYSTYAVMY